MLRNAIGRGELLVATCGGAWEKGEPQFAPTDNQTDSPTVPEVVLKQGEPLFAPTDNQTDSPTLPEVVGFVDFHRRRDEQITIYGIVVVAELRERGIGRALVAALLAPPLPTRLALKCPTDNPANNFYAALGFQLTRVETPTRRRPLNLWTLACDPISAAPW